MVTVTCWQALNFGVLVYMGLLSVPRYNSEIEIFITTHYTSIRMKGYQFSLTSETFLPLRLGVSTSFFSQGEEDKGIIKTKT